VVVSEADAIAVDGKPIAAAEPTRLWRYHKPKGLITSHRDPQGRPTVFEKLPKELPRVVSVGRLDINSEGLLLLTNDGALARHLEHPSTGWTRRYRVRAHGVADPEKLKRLADGVVIEGVRYGPVDARLESVKGANAWLAFGLKEGKNREIRKLCAHLGLDVTRLIRIAYGPFQLGELGRAEVAIVPPSQLSAQLGKAAEQFTIRGEQHAHRRRPA
jgi:23S rRNA pseudouridine2605 synthase